VDVGLEAKRFELDEGMDNVWLVIDNFNCEILRIGCSCNWVTDTELDFVDVTVVLIVAINLDNLLTSALHVADRDEARYFVALDLTLEGEFQFLIRRFDILRQVDSYGVCTDFVHDSFS